MTAVLSSERQTVPSPSCFVPTRLPAVPQRGRGYRNSEPLVLAHRVMAQTTGQGVHDAWSLP